ncbi:MAG: hypothetical protein AAGJ29_13790 [Pseudomonadota bacterium]
MTPNSSALAKIIGLFLVTLVIGAVMGAAITGHYVRARIDKISSLREPEGFMREVMNVIGSDDPQQIAQIEPIVWQYSEEFTQEIDTTRRDLINIIDRLGRELEPHLTEDQRQSLVARRAALRARISDRIGEALPEPGN